MRLNAFSVLAFFFEREDWRCKPKPQSILCFDPIPSLHQTTPLLFGDASGVFLGWEVRFHNMTPRDPRYFGLSVSCRTAVTQREDTREGTTNVEQTRKHEWRRRNNDLRTPSLCWPLSARPVTALFQTDYLVVRKLLLHLTRLARKRTLRLTGVAPDVPPRDRAPPDRPARPTSDTFSRRSCVLGGWTLEYRKWMERGTTIQTSLVWRFTNSSLNQNFWICTIRLGFLTGMLSQTSRRDYDYRQEWPRGQAEPTIISQNELLVSLRSTSTISRSSRRVHDDRAEWAGRRACTYHDDVRT